MSTRRAAWAATLAAASLTAACGGGSPTGPGPTGGGSHTVSLVVFYDENGNGALDASESVRLPDVEVSLGGAAARSARGTGSVSVAGVPEGSFTVSVQMASLPPFYAPGRLPTVRVPASGDVPVPVTLPIGSNRPNTYLAFGDSITEGNNFPGDQSYRAMLEERLRTQFGRAEVINDGAGSTKSFQGGDRITSSLGVYRPAFTLILYGTNDWNQSECRRVDRLDTVCFTIPSLRAIVRSAKSASSLPVLATIPPTNTFYNELVPPQRNDWVSAADVEIRDLARQEGALLVDVEQALLAAAGNDLSRLFVDHVHPNARGQEIIANAFFEALAHGRVGASAFDDGPALPLLKPPRIRRRRG